jgi:hypothetical protein
VPRRASKPKKLSPVEVRLRELIAAPECPDPNASLKVGKCLTLPPVPKHHIEVKPLYAPRSEVPIGTNIIHRSTERLIEHHVHSELPHQMTPYLAIGIIDVMTA